MIDALFVKELDIEIDEQLCLEEIKNSPRSYWFTAVNKGTGDPGDLNFVKDKENGRFYLGKLNRFPKTLAEVKKYIPDVNVATSYVTRCDAKYEMVPHIDPGRTTAIIIPLGSNKGEISFWVNGDKVFTHKYKCPTLTRVDIEHSANNTSDLIRYGITVEVPGGYLNNYFNR